MAYLSARLAVAYIRGLQREGVGASIKHYVCNDEEFERFGISSEVGERALREIYLRTIVVSSLHRPDEELKAFAKVHLEPGECKTVTLRLDREALLTTIGSPLMSGVGS